jgi:two-component system, sporulation sensor kinase E
LFSVFNQSIKQIYDGSDAAIAAVDLEGNLLYKNTSGMEFLSESNIDAKLDLLCAVSNKQIYKSWHDLKKTNNFVKMTFINANNELVNIQSQLNFLSEYNLFIIHLNSTIDNDVDTTSKVQYFEQLMNIFSEFNQPIVLSNKDGVIIGYNQIAMKLLQLDLVLVNLHYEYILNNYKYSPSDLIQFYKDLGRNMMGEIMLNRTIDGVTKQVKLLGIYYEEKEILISTFIPLTTQIEKAKGLNSSDLALKLLGESTAKILHEINNPLTTLKGYLKLLSKSNSSNSTYYGIIEKELSKIEALTSDLLYISNPRSDLYQRADFVAIILECITLFEQQLEQAQCRLEFTYDEFVEYHFFGQHDRIKQVLINLIKNAFEAIMEKEKNGLIQLELKKENGNCLLTISDNGGGIPEDLMDKLFKPFFTTKDEGTGLGLSITKQLIEEHNGFIKVKNLEEGTSFFVSIPAYEHRVNKELVYDMIKY